MSKSKIQPKLITSLNPWIFSQGFPWLFPMVFPWPRSPSRCCHCFKHSRWIFPTEPRQRHGSSKSPLDPWHTRHAMAIHGMAGSVVSSLIGLGNGLLFIPPFSERYSALEKRSWKWPPKNPFDLWEVGTPFWTWIQTMS